MVRRIAIRTIGVLCARVIYKAYQNTSFRQQAYAQNPREPVGLAGVLPKHALCLIGTFGVLAALCIDADDIAFVDEERHLYRRACFKYGLLCGT